ncbi:MULTISPECIES: hypothetical protein [unclassified Microcoleus]
MFINLNVIVTCFCVVTNPAKGDRASEVVETERSFTASGHGSGGITSCI